MASGHVNRILKAEHMAAPTNPANVKKVLANSEPSTHGRLCSLIPGLGVKLSNARLCRAHCSLRGRGEPSA